jgi:hypothetical protein
VSAQRRIAGILVLACFVVGGIGVTDAVAAPVPGAPARAPRSKAPKGFPVPAPLAPGAAPAAPLTWLTAAQTTGGRRLFRSRRAANDGKRADAAHQRAEGRA